MGVICNMKYSVKILEVGKNVYDMVNNGLLILFNNEAPEDLKPFCVITDRNKHEGEIKIGDQLTVNNKTYSITALGSVANENLYSLGHVTLCFDGAKEAKLPGHIHLTPDFESDLTENSKIVIA